MNLGFIGLGAMGLPMCQNLIKAGQRLTVFDLEGDRLAAATAAGARPVMAVEEVVASCDVLLASLPSSDAFVAVADQEILPVLKAGQTVVDMGTTTPPEARRLAKACTEKGAALVDAPVSGGPSGAEKGELYVFVGGEDHAVRRCWPLFEILGGDGRVTHCGPAGAGQVAKGVNQLMMGLVNAALLETVAFGVRGGLAAETIARAIGEEGQRGPVARTARRVAAGEGDGIGVKFRELPYFLREAEEAGFSLPLTQTLYAFCDAGERVVIDDNRPAPAFWRELMERGWEEG